MHAMRYFRFTFKLFAFIQFLLEFLPFFIVIFHRWHFFILIIRRTIWTAAITTVILFSFVVTITALRIGAIIFWCDRFFSTLQHFSAVLFGCSGGLLLFYFTTFVLIFCTGTFVWLSWAWFCPSRSFNRRWLGRCLLFSAIAFGLLLIITIPINSKKTLFFVMKTLSIYIEYIYEKGSRYSLDALLFSDISITK